ncbi:MAG: hypothetical protein E7240_05160 [Lachnospiraceae bacterium]|nr:hypothetical protein [Lachnospiraceae bacterium]
MKKLIRDGNFVYAQICGIAQNTSVQINGRHPFVVECRYQDPFTGIVHIFKSRDLMFDPSGMILNPNVAVYVNPKNYDSYFVDIDTVLPMIEKH